MAVAVAAKVAAAAETDKMDAQTKLCHKFFNWWHADDKQQKL